ncbi:hypothetical protein CL176_11740 [Suicoccus acidiformans]|uniref:Uncharacterized protein n=1 Tax=Suicoccus acidiformans TaxID=2036206 RepID=A0A347WNG1_9LACT|nr:hypothetical protein [Suicoccus acidiformans]AXY26618.1 hypothetical protein CL176_11740 [Suicoccus acidiformans]
MKRVKIILTTMVLGLLLADVSKAVLAENISPIESIEWGTGVTSESVEMSEESEAESQSTENLEAASGETEEPAQEDSAKEEDSMAEASESSLEEVSTPQELLNRLINGNDTKVLQYTVFDLMAGQIQGIQKVLMYGDNYAYLSRNEPPYLPQSIMFEVDAEGTPQRVFVSLEDVMKYAADAMTIFPESYAGTVVEEFYQYSQEHAAELENKFVELDLSEELLADYQEANQLNQWLLQAVASWMDTEGIDATRVSEEGADLFQIEQDEALHQQFNEIAQGKASDMNAIADFTGNFTEGYFGSVSFAYALNELGVALLNQPNETADTGLEYYLNIADVSFYPIEDEQILSQEAFEELLGFEFLQALQELNASLDTQELKSQLEQVMTEENQAE